MEDSLATWVGRDGRATTIIDRKSRYFSTLGMNDVFDLSDASIGSHIFKLPFAVQEKKNKAFVFSFPCCQMHRCLQKEDSQKSIKKSIALKMAIRATTKDTWKNCICISPSTNMAQTKGSTF